MRKGLIYLVLVIFFFSLLTIQVTTAPSGTMITANPTLIQDSQIVPSAPDINSYPSTHNNTATVTNPTNAYDKDQATYATVTPTTTTYQYFNVKGFNTTTIRTNAFIDINLKYSVQIYRAYYKITLYVGGASYALQIISQDNVTTPTLRTWTGIIEPKDGLWNATDLGDLLIKVEVRKASTSGTVTCTFNEYEAWATVHGDGFALKLNVTDVPGPPNACVLWQVNITFNPLVLQCVTAWEGPFLKQAGNTYALSMTINNVTGWVTTGTSLKTYTAGGASGSGILGTIAFKVIAQGNSNLAFDAEQTKLRAWDSVNTVLVPIPHTTVDSYFRSIQGDVNGDTEVNALDLYLLGRAYGAVPAPPECDFDKNSAINSADLTILKQNYGS